MPPELRIEAPATEVAKRRPKMMVLPIGEFRMGSQKYSDEQPVHAVKISKRFALSETEVTQGQYQAVMGENLSHFKDWPDWEMLPVEQVSWLDAVKYCNKLSASEGLSPCYVFQGDEVRWEGLECQGYRLPTEAEWEYAARADETTEYAGSDRLDEVAWHDGNSNSKTHPVGTKKANAWFLKDLSGNVWEWVWDWYADSYEATGGQDPIGPASGSERVVRGGSWLRGAELARVAYRNRFVLSDRDYSVGFRLARSYP
jgi:formylglycine-generating enzyme required for sulfatase activity